MNVSLFIPCLVEHGLPEAGVSMVRVLRRAGATCSLPKGQTCCGQPLYKMGQMARTIPLAKQFIDLFEASEHVVSPSGSCVNMVRHYPDLFQDQDPWKERAQAVAAKTFELTEFLVEHLECDDFGAALTARAVYHDSCQVGRVLGVKEPPRRLLENIQGLELLELSRPDACCGFGGIFSMQFPDVSEAILKRKVDDILQTGAELVVSAEVSCLLNIKGYLDKQGHGVEVLHVAQVLDRGMGQ